MKMKSEREVAQLCPTLRNPMDRSLPGSSIHGIFQASVLEWGAIAFSEASPRYSQKEKKEYKIVGLYSASLHLPSFKTKESPKSAVETETV